ncbi:MAG: cysteine hydrolase family protein [Ktedonobacteraceae bacterium]
MATSTIPPNLIEQSKEFLSALVTWEYNLPSISWNDLQTEAKQERVALVSIDMINGFCYEGVLSSSRVRNIIPAVVSVFKGAYNIGIREFVLTQDCHKPDALEFADFPPHCQEGTREADTIPELVNLPFANLYKVVPKNSLNAFHGSELGEWLESHSHYSAIVIVGDCTDLCIHQMALHLKIYANEHNLKMRVIVPENAVQTYDMSVGTANAIGALPHHGDFMHLLFLYHMQLSGVEVVREVV